MAIETADVAALISTELRALTSDQIVALRTDQAFALATKQAIALTTAQLVALETQDVEALSTNSIAALLTAQIAALISDELVALRTAAQRPNTELLRQRAFEGLSSDGRLVIQADGQVKVVGPQLLGRLHLDEPAPLGDNPSPARLILPISEKPALLAFTDAGRVALLRWEFAGQQPGTLEKFLPEGMSGERVVQLLPLPEDGTNTSVGLLSSDGRFKRLPIEDFQELSGRAASVLKLKDGVTLQRVVLCRKDQELVVGSSTGRLLRLAVNEANLPVMGRNAQGPVLLRLLPGETVVGAAGVAADGSVLLASRGGQLKRLAVNSLRRCQRDFKGQHVLEQRGARKAGLKGQAARADGEEIGRGRPAH